MKKYILATIVALGLAATSCDSYLDINENPNSPAENNLDPSLLFPGAELAFCNSYGDYLRITGGYFAQYYCQLFGTSNYLDYSQFSQSATRSSTTYTNLCVRVLNNMNTAANLAEQSEEWGTYLACKVFKAATYQIFVDCYSSCPYSEGMDLNNLTPKYDDGQEVYEGILAELDDALSKANNSDAVCTNYLFSGERASAWIKLANALKLRILMRMSNAVNVQSQLASLIAEDNFPTEDVCWEGIWTNASGQANPFYQEEFATYFGSNQQNVALNLALMKTMEECMDAREEAFFNKNDNGNYWGGVSGTNFTTSSTYKSGYFCRPNMAYNSPVYFITKAETEFFLAEYYARYGSASEAEAHYKAAVEASFESAGLSASQAQSVLDAYPFSVSDYKRVIGIQKWVAMSGTNPFEGYCELRRLKYPTFGSATGDQIYNVLTDAYDESVLQAGNLYTPISYLNLLGANKVLQRWPYPSSSQSTNSNTPNFTNYDDPIFWAE